MHEQQDSSARHSVATPATFSHNGTAAVHLPCVPVRPAVTASVYQMMRGAEMLFAALFAVVFLRRRCGWGLAGRRCFPCPFISPAAWAARPLW